MATSFGGPPHLPVAPSAPDSCLGVLPQPLLSYCCFLAAGKVRRVERAVGIQNKSRVFLFTGGAGSGSLAHPDPECCSRPAFWEEPRPVGRVAVGETSSLLFVSSKSCCCPSLGLGGPAGLDPVCACFLWGGQRLERRSPSCIKPQGGTSYFFLRAAG